MQRFDFISASARARVAKVATEAITGSGLASVAGGIARGSLELRESLQVWTLDRSAVMQIGLPSLSSAAYFTGRWHHQIGGPDGPVGAVQTEEVNDSPRSTCVFDISFPARIAAAIDQIDRLPDSTNGIVRLLLVPAYAAVVLWLSAESGGREQVIIVQPGSLRGARIAGEAVTDAGIYDSLAFIRSLRESRAVVGLTE